MEKGEKIKNWESKMRCDVLYVQKDVRIVYTSRLCFNYTRACVIKTQVIVSKKGLS